MVRVAEAAKLLGVTRQAIYLAAKEGRIKSRHRHGLLLVDPATFTGGKTERNEA